MEFINLISFYVLLIFAAFLVLTGIVMVVNPQMIRIIIGKAASTKRIHFTELIIRMIPAAAMIGISSINDYGILFFWFGCFMILTSVVLMILPREWHYTYARRCAEVLKPNWIRILGPFSILAGYLLFYVLQQ